MILSRNLGVQAVRVPLLPKFFLRPLDQLVRRQQNGLLQLMTYRRNLLISIRSLAQPIGKLILRALHQTVDFYRAYMKIGESRTALSR